MDCDVAILGGGAAGLMCAIEAGRRGRRVIVIEHNREIGRKILISGGGRCNFTNLHCRAENFHSLNPHFAKSALARYTPAEFVGLVRRHGIAYHEKKLGQLFCDGSAAQIVRMLETECRGAGVRIVTGRRIDNVVREADAFAVGDVRARSVVVATGGLSIQKIGATDAGYGIARAFGLKVVEPRPALVPLVFAPPDRERWCDLAGVSAEAVVEAGGRRYREKLLITHRGLSGPAVLQASTHWRPGEEMNIDLAPDGSWTPRRLLQRWRQLHGDEERFHEWRIVPAGTEGYAKAEVTAGGVDTNELDSRTMQARRAPGLYFIGEAVDVTGDLGGFNFQWAWASGWAAGQEA